MRKCKKEGNTDEEQPVGLSREWRSYELYVPQSDILTEFYREGDCESWIDYAADFDESFNVVNLFWRYTGIGREQLGWPTEEQIDRNTQEKCRVLSWKRSVHFFLRKHATGEI